MHMCVHAQSLLFTHTVLVFHVCLLARAHCRYEGYIARVSAPHGGSRGCNWGHRPGPIFSPPPRGPCPDRACLAPG